MAPESNTIARRAPVSRLSLRRKTVQMALALLLILIVNIVLLARAIAVGPTSLVVLASVSLALVSFGVYRFVHSTLRVVALEIWIREMGAGNLDYTVNPSGNDEVNELAAALDRLRQRSIEALQLDRVRELSDDLRRKNEELEGVLTELRQTQDQIILRQKLVELGELTAGVAHEIRNPLNFMRNFSESSEELVAELRESIEQHVERLREDERSAISGIIDELTENMARIRSHGDRADRIVRDMAMIGRGGGKLQPVDINDLLNDRAMIASHSAQAFDEDFQIDIESDCDADVGELRVVPEDMGRVFFNVVGNACFAMDEKRRAIDRDSGSYKPTLWLRTERIAEQIVIRVRDNGLGIPDDAMDKIFNPFFTTKPSGTGVGLGLSFSNDVVRQYGGSISAESEPGEFTEMTIRLPTTSRADLAT